MPTAAVTILDLLDIDFAPKRLVRRKRGNCGSRLATDKHANHHQHRRDDNTLGHYERLLSSWRIPSCQVVSIQATEPTVNRTGGKSQMGQSRRGPLSGIGAKRAYLFETATLPAITGALLSATDQRRKSSAIVARANMQRAGSHHLWQELFYCAPPSPTIE
jgi:hypothetical protein